MLLRQGRHGGRPCRALRNPQDAVAGTARLSLQPGPPHSLGLANETTCASGARACAQRGPFGHTHVPTCSLPLPWSRLLPAALTYPPFSPPCSCPISGKATPASQDLLPTQLPSCPSPGTASRGLGLHSRSPSPPLTPSWPCSQLASTPPLHTPGPHSCPSPVLGQGHFLSARDLSSQDCKGWPSSHCQCPKAVFTKGLREGGGQEKGA